MALIMKPKTVIDTNIIVASLSSYSEYHWVIESILNKQIDLFVTNEILLEYEEILKIKYSLGVADNFLTALRELPNVHFVTVFFKWDLLKDADDNKFIDCYVAAAAEYLVTADKGFNILRQINFPPINVVSIRSFNEIISIGI